jgi:4-amino-4-deoxy-L-arabinose transferase-like glycosyltransferase
VPPNVPPRSPFGGAPARRPIRFPCRGVILVAVLSLLPRLWISATRAIDYDGYWHVFVAGQDRWENFIAGVSSNAHPPLFYLFLRGAMAFGRTELSFRLVSLLAGVGAVIAGAGLAWRIGRNAMVAVWAAAAFASCFAPVVLSCEVRSYMLALFFILVSFGGCLELLDGSESHQPARSTASSWGGPAPRCALTISASCTCSRVFS